MTTEITLDAASWYGQSIGNDQGLVVCEKTGKNIAVCYSVSHAPLIAAAPDLLREAKALIERLGNMPIHTSHYDGLCAAVSKAEPK